MRALIAPTLLSSILLTPFAYGNSLQHAPFGSVPSEHSVTLSFLSSAKTLSSYLVDSKGFYDHAVVPVTGNTPASILAADDSAGVKGSSPMSVDLDAFILKTLTGGTGTFSENAGSSHFGSSGGGNSGAGGLGLFGFNGPGQGSGFGGKGLGLLPIFANSEFAGLGLGSEGLRDASPSVSTTPLPGSWTMMLLGLVAFGALAGFRKLTTTGIRPTNIARATE